MSFKLLEYEVAHAGASRLSLPPSSRLFAPHGQRPSLLAYTCIAGAAQSPLRLRSFWKIDGEVRVRYVLYMTVERQLECGRMPSE